MNGVAVDDDAWAQTRRRLHGFVAARLRPPAAVEDVVQDVLETMVASIERLADASKLDAWAYQIARNAITDEYRRRGRQSGLLSTLGMPAEATADLPAEVIAAADQVELSGCLRPMVDALAEPYRQALTLTGLDGLTQHAAAAAVGVPVPTMKSRVQRARRQLGEQLRACCDIDLSDTAPHGRPVNGACASTRTHAARQAAATAAPADQAAGTLSCARNRP